MVASQRPPESDHILVVSSDVAACGPIIRTLVNAGGYRVSLAGSFEDGLDLLLKLHFSLALIDVKLPDLSGIDLMTATSSLCCGDTAVILMDDELSVKSAVAAFRMGAIDFITKPVNLDFMLMRIDRHTYDRRAAQLAHEVEVARRANSAPKNGDKPTTPTPPSVALEVSQEQFTRINQEIFDLYGRIDAQFIGLIDATHNVVGSVGGLASDDLLLLTRALSTGKTTNANTLATILGESPFYSTYLEGADNGVYIIDFGKEHRVSLLVICPISAKRGVVWLYSKRAAANIDAVLNLPAPQAAAAASS